VPIVVYTGPTRSPADVAKLEAREAAAPRHKRKIGAKHSEEKALDENAKENVKDGKATDGKAADGDAAKAKAGTHPWTPLSSSALAASPPAELQGKPAADTAKKPHKADAAPKPVPAQ
jgi:hypothetical protein